MTLRGHSQGIINLNQLQSGYLVSASSYSEQKVRVWNLTDGSSIKNITGFYRVLVLKNGDLFCGPNNISIIDGASWTIKKVLYGFSMNRAVVFGNDEMAFSNDGNIWIWNTTNWRNRLNISLPNIGPSIYHLAALNNGDIAAACTDSIVRIWDSKNGNLKMNITGEHYGPALASLKNGYLALGFTSSILRIVDTRTGITKKTLNNQGFLVSLEVLENGDLVTGDQAGSIRIFDVNTGLLKLTLNNSQNTGLQSIKSFENGGFAVGSDDMTIKIWKRFF